MSTSSLYLVGGLALLLAVVLPTALKRVALSSPIVLLLAGVGIGFLPMPEGVNLHPAVHPNLVTHATELTVLVALLGVGLALDRKLDVRSRQGWTGWRSAWRLVGIAMPACIALIALLGWALGLPLASALLLAAALSPTDPVLAADLQVEGPTTEEDEHVDERDEVRFALTSEAGLNDAFAFPFVALAMLMVAGPLSAADWAGWLGWHLVGRIVLGVAAGWLVGWGLGKLAFRGPAESVRLAERGEPLLGFAALGIAYGAAELVHGWGFVAVFVAALALRAEEATHGYHSLMHSMAERVELILTLMLLLLFGVSLSGGLLGALTWRGAVIGLALVLVVRPLVAWWALGRDARVDRPDDGRMGPRERWVAAIFGVRGIGSMFYVSYALSHSVFPGEPEIWSSMAFTVVLSVVLHGVAATPVLRWLDSIRDRHAARAASRGATAVR